MSEKKSLILDLHIPYGITPISYIGSYQLTGSNEEKNAYLTGMVKEVLSWEGELEDYEIRAVRLSGGAATVMKPDLLGQLLSGIRRKLPVVPHAEVSFDALPNTIGTPSLTGISQGQPNRAELMMRSYREEDLRALKCPYNLQDIKNAILFFGKFHMNNLGLTINYGIPGQRLKDFEYTVKSCINIHPAHISVLPLDVTDAEGMAPVEERLAMFQIACKRLQEGGYIHYAAGMFCLPGHEYRFEAMLRNGDDVLGLGLNAWSMMDGYLTRNTNNLKLYRQNAGDFEKLTAQVNLMDTAERAKNYIRGRLTMTQGLVPEQFEKRFGSPVPAELSSCLAKITELGWIEEKGGSFVPTELGMFHEKDLSSLLFA